MSDAGDRGNAGMGAQHFPEEEMDRYLTNKASAFRYPPTPDIASSVRDKLVSNGVYKARNGGARRPRTRARGAWAATGLVVVLLLAATLAVPQVRSFVGDVYTGVAKVFHNEPGPVPVPNLPQWTSDLTGETDLGNLERQMKFPVKLPTIPADLGLPDYVYHQINADADTIVLVWLDRAHPDKARLALYIMTNGSSALSIVDKNPDVVDSKLNGLSAYWVAGPQPLEVYGSLGAKTTAPSQIVSGKVLIWQEKIIQGSSDTILTYRLESGLSMSEAMAVASSLQEPKTQPTPVPTTTPVSPLAGLDLAGETNGFELEERTGFHVKVPIMIDKPELVQPDKYFLQDLHGTALIMLWFVPGRTDDVRMALMELKDGTEETNLTSSGTRNIEETTVNGVAARWVQGAEAVFVTGGTGGQTLVTKNLLKGSHILIWEQDGITYRLETAGTMEDAVRIAEALK